MVEECGFEGVEVLGEDLVELGTGEDTGVEVALPHDAEIFGSAAVLGGCNLFEVLRTIVQLVTVDVIDLHAFCTLTIKRLVHEMVAETIAVLAHFRILRASASFPTRAIRTKRVFKFLPLGIEEIAVGVCPEDLAADLVGRYLFAALVHKPQA